MKTFEKWLDKKHYQIKYSIDTTSFYTIYKIKGSEGTCKVSFNHFKSRGCTLTDDRGNQTECKNIKECIELVEFLVEGIC